MKKLSVLLLIATLIFPVAGCNKEEKDVSFEEINIEDLRSEKENTIKLASELYREKKAEGFDFSAGLCLAEEITEGWSVDMVHLPRTEEDDKPENQCQYYRQGKTKHFIELSLEGDLVRAK